MYDTESLIVHGLFLRTKIDINKIVAIRTHMYDTESLIVHDLFLRTKTDINKIVAIKTHTYDTESLIVLLKVYNPVCKLLYASSLNNWENLLAKYPFSEYIYSFKEFIRTPQNEERVCAGWISIPSVYSFFCFSLIILPSIQCHYPIYQPLRSGRIWHKVNF